MFIWYYYTQFLQQLYISNNALMCYPLQRVRICLSISHKYTFILNKSKVRNCVILMERTTLILFILHIIILLFSFYLLPPQADLILLILFSHDGTLNRLASCRHNQIPTIEEDWTDSGGHTTPFIDKRLFASPWNEVMFWIHHIYSIMWSINSFQWRSQGYVYGGHRGATYIWEGHK